MPPARRQLIVSIRRAVAVATVVLFLCAWLAVMAWGRGGTTTTASTTAPTTQPNDPTGSDDSSSPAPMTTQQS